MTGNLFVYRPAGPSGGFVFNDWQALMNVMNGVQGRKIIEFDDSLITPPTPPGCHIPPGQWPMKDVMWAGFGPRPGASRSTVVIQSGARFTDLRMIGGQITIINQAAPPDPSPISDFVKGDQVQIGMRDDCGNTQIVNQGTVPLFNVGANNVLFLVQNSLFGMPTPDGVTSPWPLIQQSAGSQIIFDLLGQNQTGANLVLSAPGASVLFGALSSSAQVAFEQTSISSHGGTYNFGPQGRIQRQVVPLPPAPAATASQLFSKPNVLIRCNGHHPGFTQELSSISSGFSIGNSTVPLYSGGQEVVVAEVSGGSKLKVSPFAGDTIDGETGPVHIGKHGSKTFVSDGVSNWITISDVRGAE
jgi:hypothetical protein